MTDIAYERRYCLFFDVLGFRNKVSNRTAKNIHDVLQEIRKSHNYREVYGEHTPESSFSSRRVTQFSDWINIIKDIFVLQLNLLRHGFLIRGAVTVGDLYHDDQFCFGPALIEAAELEKLAMYPRVILTDQFAPQSLFNNPTAITDLAKGRNINNMVANDLDGMFYIDYFNVIPEDFDNFDELFSYLHDLKKSIIELDNASKCNINIRLKYSWMRKKFDDMLTGISSDDELKLHGHLIPDTFKDICSELQLSVQGNV
jgi:hypothetical protein